MKYVLPLLLSLSAQAFEDHPPQYSDRQATRLTLKALHKTDTGQELEYRIKHECGRVCAGIAGLAALGTIKMGDFRLKLLQKTLIYKKRF